MKKIIISILLFALIVCIPNFANAAPCNVTNLVFRIKSFTPNGGGGCQYLVDIGFDIEHNGGNKYIYAHLWQTADYPAWGGTYGSAPTTASLNGSNVIGTIQINIGTPDVLSATYIQSGTTVMLSGTLTKTTVGIYDRYLITNVTLNFTSCPPQLRVKADVWASQSGNGSVVHCINGGLEFVLPANNFTMSTLLFCSKLSGAPPPGREYNVQMTSTNAMANALSVSYKVYVDNGNGVFLASEEVLAATFSSFSLYTGNNYNGGRVEYLPYSTTAPHMNRDLWIQATVIGPFTTFDEVKRLVNSCIPLPVKLTSFSARRTSSSNVNLVWQTSFEQNNSGFELQRNISGNWESLIFIPTQAPGGNSDFLLIYSYTDLNNTKGVSQYRIKQIDIDRNVTYSDIRAVRGEDMSVKTLIYPNPSYDGKVNVLFENGNGKLDVALMDMGGRIIRNWNDLNNNNIVIDNLNPGFYNLRITVRETGIQTVEKFIVNKH